MRGWIGRRFTIAFAPPLEPDAGVAQKHGLEVAVPQKRCRVTLLVDPFARPDLIAGAAPDPELVAAAPREIVGRR